MADYQLDAEGGRPGTPITLFRPGRRVYPYAMAKTVRGDDTRVS